MDQLFDKSKNPLRNLFLGLLSFSVLTGFRAGDTVQISQDLNGRTSTNFRSRSNIASVVPAGTIARVIMVQRLSSGNRGVMVEMGSGNTRRRVWLYDWANRTNDIKLCTDRSCQVAAANPQQATTARTITRQNSYYVAPESTPTNLNTSDAQPTSLAATTMDCSVGALRRANNQFACMACNCMYEAGGESFEGQKAVGEVVMARVQYRNWASNACGVILQPWQFEWTRRNPGRRRIHGQCMQAAQHALNYSGPRWATHFHSGRQPNWARSRGCRPASPAQIGGHRFYACDVPMSTIASRYNGRTQLAAQQTANQRREGHR